jgi:uncharacterized protein (TIGR00106 family)
MTSCGKNVICDFSLYPLDHGASLSKYVAGSIEIIIESGLPYKFGPMSTAVEGSYDECMAVVKQCFERMSADSERIALNLRMDFRNGRISGMESKMASVQSKLKGETNKKD